MAACSPGTLLHLIHSETLSVEDGDDERRCDAAAVAVLSRICGALPPARWGERLQALYTAVDAQSAGLSRALADRLWLRPRALPPGDLPAAYRAGALDELCRHHADGGVLVVGPRALLGPPVAHLLRLGRARAECAAASGVRCLRLHHDRETLGGRDR